MDRNDPKSLLQGFRRLSEGIFSIGYFLQKTSRMSPFIDIFFIPKVFNRQIKNIRKVFFNSSMLRRLFEGFFSVDYFSQKTSRMSSLIKSLLKIQFLRRLFKSVLLNVFFPQKTIRNSYFHRRHSKLFFSRGTFEDCLVTNII